jgi:hypothetical protein
MPGKGIHSLVLGGYGLFTNFGELRVKNHSPEFRFSTPPFVDLIPKGGVFLSRRDFSQKTTIYIVIEDYSKERSSTKHSKAWPSGGILK